MARKAVARDTIKNLTIREMQRLGVYKPEYNSLIDIYAELREQYERLTFRYKKEGYPYETTSAQGVKKSPLVTTLEGLRKDILAYSDRLCLNPKAVDGIATEKSKETKLTSMLRLMS